MTIGFFELATQLLDVVVLIGEFALELIDAIRKLLLHGLIVLLLDLQCLLISIDSFVIRLLPMLRGGTDLSVEFHHMSYLFLQA